MTSRDVGIRHDPDTAANFDFGFVNSYSMYIVVNILIKNPFLKCSVQISIYQTDKLHPQSWYTTKPKYPKTQDKHC